MGGKEVVEFVCALACFTMAAWPQVPSLLAGHFFADLLISIQPVSMPATSDFPAHWRLHVLLPFSGTAPPGTRGVPDQLSDFAPPLTHTRACAHARKQASTHLRPAPAHSASTSVPPRSWFPPNPCRLLPWILDQAPSLLQGFHDSTCSSWACGEGAGCCRSLRASGPASTPSAQRRHRGCAASPPAVESLCSFRTSSNRLAVGLTGLADGPARRCVRRSGRHRSRVISCPLAVSCGTASRLAMHSSSKDFACRDSLCGRDTVRTT